MAFNSQKLQSDPEERQRTMNALPPIVYTVAAFLFFGLGYVVGNSMGDASTYRNCSYAGEAQMVSGGEIRCSIVIRPTEPTEPTEPTAPTAPTTPTAPQDSRPQQDRPFPPAGFDKLDQG